MYMVPMHGATTRILLMKYGIDISPVVKNEEHFYSWADNLPYYRNVRDDGVMIDAGQR